MRILLVNNYWYLRGGADRVVLDTKRLLEASGHQVEIFGMQHPRNVFTRDYFAANSDFDSLSFANKLVAGLRAIYNTEAKNKLERLVKEFKPDLIHYHDICHHLSYSLFGVSRHFQIPSIMTLHNYKLISPNYNLFHHGHVGEEIKGGRYYRCLLDNCMENFDRSCVATIEAYWRQWKHYNNLIDHFIAPSEFVKKICVDYGLSEEKISVLAYPVEIDQFQLSEEDGDTVVFFGRLSAEKGVATFLAAAKLNPNIRYLVIGDGPERKPLERIAGANVEFTGFQQGEALVNFLTRARIIVVPSVWYEVSGLVILEAKAMGKIVLGSDIGAIPESLSSEFLFPAHDSQALADKIRFWYYRPWPERQVIGQKGREAVLHKHSPALYVKKLEQLYESARK